MLQVSLQLKTIAWPFMNLMMYRHHPQVLQCIWINQSPTIPIVVSSQNFRCNFNDSPLQIHGDGEQTRDYTFVEDVVEATMLSALSPKGTGEVLNVGTGKETDVKHLADMIVRISGKNISPIHIDRRDIDNIRRRVMNIEKIRKNLKWIPTVSLEEAQKDLSMADNEGKKNRKTNAL
jgi:UDP-glucose 4-epimerase